MIHLNLRVIMSITYPIYQKASSYPEKYGRETFLADAGQRSRAIIPGDDPGRPAAARAARLLSRASRGRD
jgi:hypothetical protein